jgi:peptidoglycan/LPS O-acetylase OafA/YrhL
MIAGILEKLRRRPSPRPGMTARTYMPQLDGLRFFAVMAVVVAHNWDPSLGPWILNRVNLGGLGVGLFFVLSGFLITGILLQGRRLDDSRPRSRLFFMRQFYARRFLRIFPVYYAVLIGITILGSERSQVLPWLFTYTTNIYIWHHLTFIRFSHFWTLAVEEQFYLVWPLLLLFLPRRWLVSALVTLICLAPLYRLYATFRYPVDASIAGSFTSGTLTVGHLDSLGLGSFLALAFSREHGGERVHRILVRLVLPVGVATYVTVLALSHYGVDDRALVALDETGAALVFCWLIGTASRGFDGVPGWVLDWSPIVYLGKISYGIYIFHLLIPLIAFSWFAKHLGIAYSNSGFINFVATSLATFAVASVSWHAFEAPINRLKRHFPYTREPLALVHP